MPTNKLHGVIACLLVAGSTAYAQQAPTQQQQQQPQSGEPTLTDPPAQGGVRCEPDVAGDCPAAQEPMAQPTQPAPAPVVSTDVDVYEYEAEKPWYDRMGFGLAIGGGVDDFSKSFYRDATSLGGGWQVRGIFGTKSYIAGEALYFGSAQNIDAIGLDDDAVLVGNGLQANIRVNVLKNYYVQPFVFGGAAWRHYDLTDVNINLSDVRDSDDVFELPAGAGLAGYIGGFMADIRGEYRWAWGADLLLTDENADRWAVNASLGVEF